MKVRHDGVNQSRAAREAGDSIELLKISHLQIPTPCEPAVVRCVDRPELAYATMID